MSHMDRNNFLGKYHFRYCTRAIKGRSFYSKITYSALHNGALYKLLSIFVIRYCTKILYNTLIFGNFLVAASMYLRASIIGEGMVHIGMKSQELRGKKT